MKLPWECGVKYRTDKRAGYTLIELLIVIAILSLMMGLATWNIVGKLPNWRLDGAANDVVSAFQRARALAIKDNRFTMISFTNTGNSSSSKLTIWVDDNRNWAADAGEKAMEIVVPNKHKDTYISSLVYTDAPNPAQVWFRPDGTLYKGTMPVIVTVANDAGASPSSQRVCAGRSGIASIEAGCTAISFSGSTSTTSSSGSSGKSGH